MKNINQLLKENLFFFNGDYETELRRQGLPPHSCPALWCRENPGELRKIYRQYTTAGVAVLFSATSAAHQATLAEYGAKEIYQLNRDLVGLARDMQNTRGLVAGCIGHGNQLLEPFGPCSFSKAVQEYKNQTAGLVAGGADLIVIEGGADIQTARAALLAARETCSLFTIVILSAGRTAKNNNTIDPVAALATLRCLGAHAIGCRGSAKAVVAWLEAIRLFADIPLVAQPDARISSKEEHSCLSPADFATLGVQLVKAGATCIGGGSETTPAHLQAIIKALEDHSPHPGGQFPAGISSPYRFLELGEDNPLYLIGDGFSSAAKKKPNRNKTSLQEIATLQENQGADLLAVSTDTEESLVDLTASLAVHTPLPLVISTQSPGNLEAAIRLYPGRVLLNGVEGEPECMKKIFPLAAKYGTMLICRPIHGGKIPPSAEERIQIIQYILSAGKEYGLGEDNFLVDGLALAVAAHPGSPREALKTIRLCSKVMGLSTILDLRAVPANLPGGPWLQAAYLSMAAALGLTCILADPGNQELANIRAAADLLRGSDPEARRYTSFFSREGGCL